MTRSLFRVAAVVPALLFFPLKAEGEETAAASCRRGPVTVYSAPADRATACRVAELSEMIHARIRRRLDLRHEVAVSLYIITRRPPPSSVPVAPEKIDPWLAGVALSESGAIVVRMTPGQTASDHRSLLAHELTHVIIRRDLSLILWMQNCCLNG